MNLLSDPARALSDYQVTPPSFILQIVYFYNLTKKLRSHLYTTNCFAVIY